MSDSSDVHPDVLTSEQMEKIRLEIAMSQPMVGPMVNPSTLLADYRGNAEEQSFCAGIDYLSKTYKVMRKVRGDGNCFFRAFLFGYLENLLELYNNVASKDIALTELNRFTAIINGSLQDLESVGYPVFAVETFHEVSLYCHEKFVS